MIDRVTSSTTIFENIWQQDQGLLFRSQRHGVMAVADAFPRMPLQVVVATASGTPGEIAHFYDLELPKQRKLLEVGLAIGSKILEHCSSDERSMFTLEGFAVKDHPHIVYYAGVRGQGIDRYTGPILGDTYVQRTRELLSFSPHEASRLESDLNRISCLD